MVNGICIPRLPEMVIEYDEGSCAWSVLIIISIVQDKKEEFVQDKKEESCWSRVKRELQLD
jgi:hypothetical protein